MAAQRPYGRFMGAALVGGPLLAAGIGWASPARADQTAFLNDLHNAGIHAVNGGDDALLQMGADLCQQLSWGASPQQLEGLAVATLGCRSGHRRDHRSAGRGRRHFCLARSVPQRLAMS